MSGKEDYRDWTSNNTHRYACGVDLAMTWAIPKHDATELRFVEHFEVRPFPRLLGDIIEFETCVEYTATAATAPRRMPLTMARVR
jgi:hypothetical protein